jgi:hypothetical protein
MPPSSDGNPESGSRWRVTWRRWRARVGRIAVLLLLALLCVVGGVRAASGAIAETAREAGGALAALARNGSAPRSLLLNGARFALRTATSQGSLASVLSAGHARCAERSLLAAWPRGAKDGLGGRGAALVAKALAFDGVVDAEHDGVGVVACFETGEGRASWSDPQELGQALAAAAASGDLSALGSFRYLYARTEGDGRTAHLELSSEGPLNVHQMFPKHGDAPGVDDAELPRPGGTRRVLSVVHEVARGIRAAALTGYESPETASELRRAYATELRARGFALRAFEGAQSEAAPPLVVRTAGRTVLVSFSERRTASGSWVLLLPLP